MYLILISGVHSDVAVVWHARHDEGVTAHRELREDVHGGGDGVARRLPDGAGRLVFVDIVSVGSRRRDTLVRAFSLFDMCPTYGS